MQTFLPYESFYKSSEVLDKKRCWKQVVETKQTLNLLNHISKKEFYKLNIKKLKKEGLLDMFKDFPMYSKQPGTYYRLIAHINHPAVKMWIGYEELLKHYFNVFLSYCLNVHKINTKMEFIPCRYSNYITDANDNAHKYMLESFYISQNDKPFWLANENFHRAMRARLIKKDEVFYLSKFQNDKGFNDSKYFWPVLESQTFKII